MNLPCPFCGSPASAWNCGSGIVVCCSKESCSASNLRMHPKEWNARAIGHVCTDLIAEASKFDDIPGVSHVHCGILGSKFGIRIQISWIKDGKANSFEERLSPQFLRDQGEAVVMARLFQMVSQKAREKMGAAPTTKVISSVWPKDEDE